MRFSVFILFLFNSLISQAIYLDSKNDFSYYFISSYMKHNDTHQIYNYNFNVKVIKSNIELNIGYNMDKQLPDQFTDRNNEFMLYNLNYYIKNKRFIIGFSFSEYDNWNNFDSVHSYSIILSKRINGYSSGLSYYPYIQYEQSKEKTDYYNPNNTYIGCIIRDDDLFIEPFLKLSNDFSNQKFIGIKLGIDMW